MRIRDWSSDVCSSVLQITEAFYIGVIKRGIDLIKHANRGGIGEEQREYQRNGGQRLFAARKQGQHRQLLARRLGHDLQPRLQRIIRIDQRQMRAAALEQGREQRSEMPVDLLERRQQPRAALAVEIADRPDERRVGTESVSTWRSRWSPY